MSFLGLFTFHAPFLPWVLLGFSVLLGNSASVDLMGIAVGHLYFFLDDVYPHTRVGRGRRPLRTPAWLFRLLASGLSWRPREPEIARVVQAPPVALRGGITGGTASEASPGRREADRQRAVGRDNWSSTAPRTREDATETATADGGEEADPTAGTRQ